MLRTITTFSSLYLATLFMLFANGLLTTYLALDLESKGVGDVIISSLTSAYYAGLVIGAKFGHRLIARVGHIRSYAACAGITAATVILMALIDYTEFWLAARFLMGLMMMCQYMVIESWLNDQAEPKQRGIVFGIYMAASSLGILLGQLAISLIDPIDVRMMMIVSMFFSLCLVPLSVTRAIHPIPLKAAPLNLLYFLKTLPQILLIALFGGMMVGSFYGLGPIFATRLGLDTQDAGIYMTIAVGASLVIQWPLGLLSDRMNRLLLVTIVALILSLLAIFINLPAISNLYIIIASFLAIALQFTFYPLAVAIANDNIDEDKRVSLSAILLMLFGIGAATGPLISGYLMEYFGAKGLYIFTLGVAGATIWLNLLRASRKLHTPVEESLPHVIMADGNISPIAAATLDPRIDEEAVKEVMKNEEAEEIKAALREEIEADEIEKSKSKIERYTLIPYGEYSYQRFLQQYGKPDEEQES
ncbi:MFS transporter [Ignatzschineria larvae DSM 13226]|uniref:MFS transporter n=1 Tax=Ignatzschineria larvae DSM 13226 TaxID=1111732 RepID=A0ABZ3C1T5_9GAMM|nr:MFS transporter [Ignatzschineria larvae]